MVKNLPAMQETQIQSLDQEDPLEKGMATHSIFLPGECHRQRSWQSTVHGVTQSWTRLSIIFTFIVVFRLIEKLECMHITGYFVILHSIQLFQLTDLLPTSPARDRRLFAVLAADYSSKDTGYGTEVVHANCLDITLLL